MNVHGNAIAPLHHYVDAMGKDKHERLPGMIGYPIMTARPLQQFRRLLELLNMAVVVKDGAGKRVYVCHRGMNWTTLESVCGVSGWEVLGNVESLERLSRHPCLQSWHPIIACSVRFSCAGSGAEKIKTRSRAKDPKAGEWTEAHGAMRVALSKGEVKTAEGYCGKIAENAC